MPFTGLPVLLLANYFLRHTLEQSSQRIHSYLDLAYPGPEKILFSPQYPWWKLFLPVPMLTGAWTTTTLILTHFIEIRLTAPVTWELFNLILVACSFLLSWYVLRSVVFSYTFALCFAFGTPLYHTYAVQGSIGYCLLFVYYQVLLVCIFKLLTTEQRRPLWWAGFGVALVTAALAYEAWLDFLVFAWLAAAYLAVMFVHTQRRRELMRLLAIVAVMTVVGAVYVYIKTHLGYGQVLGSESDVVFNYGRLAPAVEDVLSNVITHLYIAVTTFLPPTFVSSTSLVTVGVQQLIAEQHGYHEPFQYLVAMDHVFLWRYYAGIAFVVFAYAIVKCFRKSWLDPTVESIVLCVFMIMVGVGGPTHDFVKYRPMNSMPLLGYHAMVGALGMALLIAFGLMVAQTRVRRSAVFALMMVCAWGTIIYAALARPAFFNQAAAQVGLGENIYPDPWLSLTTLLGVSGPERAPVTAYRLQLYQAPPVPGQPHFDDSLPPLPERLPAPTLWALGKDVSIAPDSDSYHIQGNSTQAGYQISSQPFAVQPHQHLLIRIVGKVEQGSICVGVLGEDAVSWIFPPTAPRPEYMVDTADSRRISIVAANCYANATGNLPTKVRWVSASYARLP